MPTKIFRIKINDFWINVTNSPPHYARQKTKKSNMPPIRTRAPGGLTLTWIDVSYLWRT